MAKINIFQCDACKREIRHDYWDDAPTELTFTGTQNVGDHSLKEVCRPCRNSLVGAFIVELAKLRRAADPSGQQEDGNR